MSDNFKPYLAIIGVVVVCLIFLSYIYVGKEQDEILLSDNIETTTLSSFFVDIKGAVKSPGVYKFKSGDRVIDAIKSADGLLKSGNTSNINLSQRLSSEMVVYVYTNDEIKKGTTAISCNTECICNTLEVDNCYKKITENKVNINLASEEELQKLTGIGEAKAKSIIEYRAQNGNFTDIEHLKNISGIGEAIYIKIKDNITI